MKRKQFAGLTAGLVAVIILSIFIGRYQIPLALDAFWENELLRNLVLYIRIPRILSACLVGIGLSTAGLVMQTVFRNSLADPGILGVSQASGFGAALGILLFSHSVLATQMLAFIFGMIALLAALIISRRIRNERVISLVLAGIAISALFSAGLGVLKYIADPVDELPNIVFWLLGSLSNVGWDEFVQIAVITGPAILFFWFYRWRLNIHTLDKEISYSMGLNSSKELNLVLIAAVLMTSVIISVSGIIGWVGLIIPNLSRVTIGANNQQTLPFTMMMGALFTLICDNLARALLPGEIPLGIMTAFLGSAIFIVLLIRSKRFI